ncbi:peptide deformylase [Guptibacillus hwajinpoensis]|uniref:Peptide deformylase n=1 Tax=Guptibacillus hwajinpoensis TaxID=208199 RepID=A0A0J6D077_9BACL|nr:peptide deformylase [Alkalihalobacillus macyae]KMM38728.1 peptide deformylase [Alkalihalobacillus macyae]
MAIREIVMHPNEVLEVKCKPVDTFDKELHALLDDMFETMYDAEGVGLAAPQIGIDQQIAVVDTREEEALELINPEVIKSSGKEVDLEGCLSFPGLFGEVERPFRITLKAHNRFGKEFKLKAEGFFARAIQHEIDHLHGVLFTEKVIRYIDPEGAEE